MKFKPITKSSIHQHPLFKWYVNVWLERNEHFYVPQHVMDKYEIHIWWSVQLEHQTEAEIYPGQRVLMQVR